MTRWLDDEGAVAQTLAFVVGAAIFVGLLGSLVLATADSPGTDDNGAKDASNRLDAERLADLLVASPGVGWETGPDDLERLGFLHDDGTRVDDDHLDALRGAAYAADPDNDKVDYEEALEGLGLPTDGSLGFHVRMAPVGLKTTLQGADLSHVRTAYVADWGNLPARFNVTKGLDAWMVADARAQVDAYMGAGTPDERAAVAGVGLGYDDLVDLWGIDVDVYDPILGTTTPLRDELADTSLLDGDLFVDDKQLLDDELDANLGEYDLLVVGSTVDHESLTSNAVKDPVATWVLDGGTLMVLGSASQNFQWLEPLFSVGTTTVNAAPAAPDVSHPMLHEPWELDWTSYDNFGLGWDLKEEGAKASFDKFQHVITSDDEDVLAVSNEGAFGDGRIFLTSFRPEDIAVDQSPLEAVNFLSNIVLYSDRSDLYLDYGPTPPDYAAVSAAVRTTQIWDDDLGMVNIRLTVLYWGV